MSGSNLIEEIWCGC